MKSHDIIVDVKGIKRLEAVAERLSNIDPFMLKPEDVVPGDVVASYGSCLTVKSNTLKDGEWLMEDDEGNALCVLYGERVRLVEPRRPTTSIHTEVIGAIDDGAAESIRAGLKRI